MGPDRGVDVTAYFHMYVIRVPKSDIDRLTNGGSL